MYTTHSNVTGSGYDREHVTGASVTGQHPLYKPPLSDSDSIISYDDYVIASRVVECGIVPALGLVGLPANVINMVVFYRQGLRDKMNLCLFALAFADLMFLLSLFVPTVYCPAAFLSHTLLEQILRWYTLKYTINFVYAFIYTSGFLTAIIATERCICVVWPMKSATIFQTKTVAWMIVGTIAIPNLLCLPYTLQYIVTWETDESGNVTVLLKDSVLYVSNKLAFQVIQDGVLPGCCFLTFFVVSFVTVVTVRKLKTAMDWRQKTSTNVIDKRQMSLVKMLITVSCVYIVCSVPKLSLAVGRFLVGDFSTVGKYHKLYFIAHYSCLAILMVNSSVNFFIYYKQSTRFRKELYGVCFMPQRAEEESPTTYSTKSSVTA
ncbi:hypothetical protein ACOMHN_064008 [Nucella lapillus]